MCKEILMIVVLVGIAIGIVGLDRSFNRMTDTITAIPKQIGDKIDKLMNKIPNVKVESHKDLEKVCESYCKLR